MYKCSTPCIYYNEYCNPNIPNAKLTCDYQNGKELKHIPEEEKNNCKYFKSFKQLKSIRGRGIACEEDVLDS